MKRVALAAVGGLIMAAGLGLSGVTDAERIIGFLDFAGRWDPTALFVMAAAAGVFGLGHLRLRRRLVAADGARVDGPLLAGAALFGVGWGVSGLCPGPALIVAAGGGTNVLTFVAAMVAGTALHAWAGRSRLGRSQRS